MRRALVAALTILGVGFTTTLAESPSLQSNEGLAVWDATGKRIGNVIAFGTGGDTANVAFTFEGKVFTLGFSRDSVWGVGMTILLYDSPDCTGQAFMNLWTTSPVAPLIPIIIVGSDGTVWTADFTDPPRLEPTFYSYRIPGDNICYGSPEGSSYPAAVPAIELFNWRDYFTPSFSIR